MAACASIRCRWEVAGRTSVFDNPGNRSAIGLASERLSTITSRLPARASMRIEARIFAGRWLRPERGEQLREDFGRRGDDIAALEVIRVAGKVAHQAARFLDHQRARGHVPR